MPIPTTPVLMRLSDPRVEQFWDPHRLLSGLIVRSLPRDTLTHMAEIESSGRTVVWDCVAAFRPGVRWDVEFPIPDWAGRPVADVADSLGSWLSGGVDTTRVKSHRGTSP